MKLKPLYTMLSGCLLFVFGCSEDSLLPKQAAFFMPSVSVNSLKPKALAIIKQQLNDPSAYLRSHAIEVAAETGQKQFMPQILERLSDPIVAVRFAAAVAVGDMHCIPCEKNLLPLLNDANENVRIAASYSLLRLGNSKSKDVLYQGLNSPNETVRGNSVFLVGKLGNQGDLELLYQVLHDDQAVESIKFQAVESIAKLGDLEIYRSKIWPMLISKYADDRVMGIRAMGALGSYEAEVAVQTMLQDDLVEVRLTAAEQLGRMNDDSGRQEVIKYFESKPDMDESKMANQMAVLAIGRIGGKELECRLEGLLTSKSKLIQLSSAQSVLLLCR